MSAGPTPAEVTAASHKARKRFVAELVKMDPSLGQFQAVGGVHTVTVGGVRVDVEFKIIRASNGEACGWAVARVTGAKGSSTFYSPPWMEGGCTPEAVLQAVRHYREGGA